MTRDEWDEFERMLSNDRIEEAKREESARELYFRLTNPPVIINDENVLLCAWDPQASKLHIYSRGHGDVMQIEFSDWGSIMNVTVIEREPWAYHFKESLMDKFGRSDCINPDILKSDVEKQYGTKEQLTETDCQ